MILQEVQNVPGIQMKRLFEVNSGPGPMGYTNYFQYKLALLPQVVLHLLQALEHCVAQSPGQYNY